MLTTCCVQSQGKVKTKQLTQTHLMEIIFRKSFAKLTFRRIVDNLLFSGCKVMCTSFTLSGSSSCIRAYSYSSRCTCKRLPHSHFICESSYNEGSLVRNVFCTVLLPRMIKSDMQILHQLAANRTLWLISLVCYCRAEQS